MGGNALSKPSIRLSKFEYQEVERFVVNKFKDIGVKVNTIKQIVNKDSFGDLDVVICASTNRDLVINLIKQISNEFVWNGDVISFELNGFQVDVVFAKLPEYAANWMAYSDASNLVGRILHKLGLKHGFNGLMLPVRKSSTHLVGEILVSTDMDHILRFVNLDPMKWKFGFQSKEEIYEWISSSVYYNPEIFLLENRNATARYRDAKRPTYTEFLKWIELNPSKRLFPFKFNPDKSTYHLNILHSFPNITVEYYLMMAKYEHEEFIKDHWSTKLKISDVVQITGYSGKELGNFIRKIKDTIGDSITHLNETKVDIIVNALYLSERKL